MHLLVSVLVGFILGQGGTSAPSRPLECDECHVEAQQEAPVTVAFTHERHVSIACASCHVNTATSLSASNRSWCDGCHHTEQPPDGCRRCHAAGPDPEMLFDVSFSLPAGPEDRGLVFPHVTHESQLCESCHGTPPGPIDMGTFGCSNCHTEHHEAEVVDCRGCHEPPPVWAHEAVVVHQGCSGSICHKSFEPGSVEDWRRPVCEACHTDFDPAEPLPPVPGNPPDTLSSRKVLDGEVGIPTGASVENPTSMR